MESILTVLTIYLVGLLSGILLKSYVKIENKNKNIPVKFQRKPINQNRFGSIRNFNGRIMYDFRYMNRRVRVVSDLKWDGKTVNGIEHKEVAREYLDKIGSKIKSDNSFSIVNEFPNIRRKELFVALEKEKCKKY